MFENIRNFADLKKAYHKAARENHPDMGGDTETMKRINNDFERAERKSEYISPMLPSSVLRKFQHLCDKNGLPRFTMHGQ